jgi:hypothetical protein
MCEIRFREKIAKNKPQKKTTWSAAKRNGL